MRKVELETVTTTQKPVFPTGLRVKILSALWGLAIDSVDEQVRNITLRAHSQCLGDIVADCEVLDLFEAALATLYHLEHPVGSRIRQREASSHPEDEQGHESEDDYSADEVKVIECELAS